MQRYTSEMTMTWAKMRENLVVVKPTRHTKNLFVHFSSPDLLDILTVYQHLQTILARNDSAFCCGRLSSTSIVAYIRKNDFAALPSVWSMPSAAAETLGPRLGNVKVLQEAIVSFAAAVSEVCTGIDIKTTESGGISFEQMVSGAAHLTNDDLSALKGSITIKTQADRTEQEKALLRVYKDLVQVRNDRKGHNKNLMVWSAVNPPTPIVPFRFMTNVDTTFGTRLMEQSGGQLERFSLRSLFEDSSILARYAVVFMGPDSTSGWGKSAVMKRLACWWSRQRHLEHSLPEADASVVWSNTVDDLRNITFSCHQSLCLDEFALSDTTCLQYASANMCKTLFDPGSTGNLRCRNSNCTLAAGTSRIMSTNADSVESWGGTRIPFTEPLRRKLIVFRIDQPLVVPGWSSHPSYVRGEM
jgi:hypothetical protein